MIRGLARRVVPDVVRRAAGRWRRRPRRGLPPGLGWGAFERAARQVSERSVRSVRHVGLRTWKRAGTYTITFRLSDGAERSLVYKRASYSLDEIPANRDLPVRQGPPEYRIAGLEDGPLTRFLPRTYWRRSRPDERSFEYLFEDLAREHEQLVSHQRRAPISSVGEPLAAMHRALREQFPGRGEPAFIDFTGDYSRRLWEYALAALSACGAATVEPAVERLLERRDEVAAVFLDPSFEVDRPTQAIHGDCNGTNLWVRPGDGATTLKAVDWEWAGYGLPHADLISILKWRPAQDKRELLARYCAAAGRSDVEGEMRWLRRANMERALLDAGFLARQHLDPARSQPWFMRWVRGSVEHLLHETTMLTSSPRRRSREAVGGTG